MSEEPETELSDGDKLIDGMSTVCLNQQVMFKKQQMIGDMVSRMYVEVVPGMKSDVGHLLIVGKIDEAGNTVWELQFIEAESKEKRALKSSTETTDLIKIGQEVAKEKGINEIVLVLP